MDYLQKSRQILADYTAETGFSRKLVGINLLSPDPLRLAEFYGKVLGAAIVNDSSHGGPQRIEIWFGKSDDSSVCITAHFSEGISRCGNRGIRGFELRVADANAECERLQAMGVKIAKPPVDLPWGYRYFSINDPDGNEIDLVQAL